MYWKWSVAKIINGAPSGGDGIIAYWNGHANEVAISESLEITLVAYLGQITCIGSGRARNLEMALSREGTV